MKHFSAQYIITNSGPPLKRGVITTSDDGTITNIKDTGGILEEMNSVRFYNGIIVPGFVNCHCHLELSHMKNMILPGTGLGNFIEQVRSTRNINPDSILDAAAKADNELFTEGVVLCADICNTSITFRLKQISNVRYINLLEVFGIDPVKADKRMNEIMKVAEEAEELKIQYQLVPHAAYSMSLTLLRLLREKSKKNTLSSIHFMETTGEAAFLEKQSGPLIESYKKSELIPPKPEMVRNHSDAIMIEVTHSGNLILVHNTYVDKKTIENIKQRGDLFWCLCPNSNIYIENEMPPLNLLLKENCDIVIGTDSLASNNRLSILEELKTIQQKFPELSIEELIGWATINGARAMHEDKSFGTIEVGKKPGLLLLQDVDLHNMKLLADSSVTRLI